MQARSQSRYFPRHTLNLTPSGGPPSAGSAGASMASTPPKPCVNGPGANPFNRSSLHSPAPLTDGQDKHGRAPSAQKALRGRQAPIATSAAGPKGHLEHVECSTSPSPLPWPAYFDPERHGGECANCGTRKPKASARLFCLICGEPS